MGMKKLLERFRIKASRDALVERCEAELEVHYTKLLTREFCLMWISREPLEKGQMGVLLCADQGDRFFCGEPSRYFLYVALEEPSDEGFRSIRSCVVVALDVEESLALDLEKGHGCCKFVR